MSMDGVVDDVARLEVESLQLQDVSALALNSNPSFIQKHFDLWLSLPQTNRLVRFIAFSPLLTCMRNNFFLVQCHTRDDMHYVILFHTCVHACIMSSLRLNAKAILLNEWRASHLFVCVHTHTHI